MEFRRGWPFSIVDQLRDLRYDVGHKGFLYGIPSWFVGQATRYKTVFEASKIKGTEMADRNSAGPGIKMVRISNRGGTMFSLIGYYLRLFVLTVAVIGFIVMIPFYAVAAVAALAEGNTDAATTAAVMAVLGTGFAYWLYSGDYDYRPGATMAD